MAPQPYYQDDQVQLYLGDSRELLPALGLQADLVCTDPPYGETSLAWDRWPDGWPTLAATAATSMWCFGSMRMFLDHGPEFTAAGWRLSQDIVWEKNNGSGATVDRFRRVHEHALHWYRGPWSSAHHDTPRVAATAEQVAKNGSALRTTAPVHHGTYGPAKRWTETGTRLMRSVIQAQSMKGRAVHPTEKPLGLLDPLIRYACPEGGLVLDPFAGSGSTLDAARQAGRRAVGIEASEQYAERAALRLSQATLPAA
jgi:site-specific DNA-methyltransferase (adenine-specific)